MSLKAEELRRKHPRFLYQRFDLERVGNNLKITFHFKLEPDIIFTPDIVIESIDRSRIDSLDTPTLERLAFHLGLIEMLSYWKTACPAEVVIEAGALDQWQIRWWKELWLRGMGEFFYVNQIDFRGPDYLKISAPAPDARDGGESRDTHQPARRSLVMVSGGKDSAFTVHELRAAGEDFNCLLLNPPPSAVEVAAIAGCTAPITVRRTLDARMLDLNRQGYLNGHTPFSALACDAGPDLRHAVRLRSRRRLQRAQQRRGQCPVPGRRDQPSVFEDLRVRDGDTRLYARDYLAPGVSYFSIVRPLFEIQVCRLFAQCTEYFRAFKSCNREQKQGTWCGQCPKCVSVFITMAPFISREPTTGHLRQGRVRRRPCDSAGAIAAGDGRNQAV